MGGRLRVCPASQVLVDTFHVISVCRFPCAIYQSRLVRAFYREWESREKIKGMALRIRATRAEFAAARTDGCVYGEIRAKRGLYIYAELRLKELEERYKAEVKAKEREIEIYKQENLDLKEVIRLLASQSVNVNVSNEARATSESQSMSQTRKIDIKNESGSSVGFNYGENVDANQIGGTIHNYATQQNLAEAAAEIQQLLQQLEQTYSTNIPSEKMVVVEEAIKRIEADPSLKERVLGAIKTGSIEAFKELINHPLVNILLAALEGWNTGN